MSRHAGIERMAEGRAIDVARDWLGKTENA